MKKLMIALLVMMASVAHATVMCGVEGEDPKQSNTYDRNLYYQEMTGQRAVLVSKDFSSVKDLDISQMKTLEQWSAINGQLVVFFTIESDKRVSIGTARVNIKNKDSVLELQALSSGALGNLSQPLSLIYDHVSISCLSTSPTNDFPYLPACTQAPAAP